MNFESPQLSLFLFLHLRTHPSMHQPAQVSILLHRARAEHQAGLGAHTLQAAAFNFTQSVYQPKGLRGNLTGL